VAARSIHRWIPRGAIAALALGLVIAAAGLVREVDRKGQDYRSAASRAVPASRWQLESPQARRLEHFLRQVQAPIPEGGSIGWTSPRGRGGEGDLDFFTHLWAAYLMPRHHVMLGRLPGALEWADYWIDYRPSPSSLDRPNFEVLVEHPRGAGYRVPEVSP
jgi:hypothetical protein